MATPVERTGTRRMPAARPLRPLRQTLAGLTAQTLGTVMIAGMIAGTGMGCADFGADPGPLLTDAGVGPAPGDSCGAGAVPGLGTGGSLGLPGTDGNSAPPVGPVGPDAAAGAGGRPGTGGAGAGDAAPPTAADTAPPVDPTPAGECPASASFAILLTMDVTWPQTTATTAGTGVVRLWNRADLTANGNSMTGMVTPCGTILPETTLTGLGRVAAGGRKILIEIPNAVWDLPTMPKFPITGMRSTASLPAMIQFELVAPLGFERPDVKAAWPDSYTALKEFAKDIDGDGSPGYVSQPRASGDYALPPTSLGLGGLAPAAEKIFLINRNITTFTGTRSTCDTITGTAVVHNFDSHVVGCVVKGGTPCKDAQIDFVDQNRMKYIPKSATFKAQRVPANSTCAEIRRVVAP